MTNNFDKIREYFAQMGMPQSKNDVGNNFFDIQLIRRGKDHPGMPAANYTFKTYYIDYLETYDRYRDEIIKCCDMFYLRAYVSVNMKSKDQAQKQALKKYADNVCMNEVKKPWKVFSSVCGSLVGKDKRWIIDVDDVSLLDDVHRCLDFCDCKFFDVLITTIPTRSGVHLITHPFNMMQFEQRWDALHPNIAVPEIKKNHITLLYENVD